MINQSIKILVNPDTKSRNFKFWVATWMDSKLKIYVKSNLTLGCKFLTHAKLAGNSDSYHLPQNFTSCQIKKVKIKFLINKILISKI